jgi:hypothetical protein
MFANPSEVGRFRWAWDKELSMNGVARAGWLGALTAVVLGMVGGCVRDDPAFKVADMAAAPGLVGTWSGTGATGQVLTLKISETTQVVKDGRLLARGADQSTDNTVRRTTVPVYTLHADFGVPASAPADGADAKEQAPTALDLRGYLLTDGESQLLCLQSEEKPAPGLASAFTVNTQWIVQVRLSGDKLTLRMPKTIVLLSPSTRLLDPPVFASADAECPALEAAMKADAGGKGGGGGFFTTDADRALGVVRRYGARPEFWQEPAIEMARVR